VPKGPFAETRNPSGLRIFLAESANNEASGVLFFITYCRRQWLPLRIKERQWLINLQEKIFENPHYPSRNVGPSSAPGR
jgi:hypothetical protein